MYACTSARLRLAPSAGWPEPRRLQRRVRMRWRCAVGLAALLAAPGCQSDAEEERARGNVLFNQGRYGDARTHYARAVAASPGDALLHVALGNAELELRSYGAAEKAFTRALELDPEGVGPRRGLMTVISHTARPGDREAFRRYLAHAEALLARRPHDRTALTNAGILLSETADPRDSTSYREAQKRAEIYLRRALTEDDRNPRSLFHLALVYARRGEAATALTVVRRLEELDVRDGLATYAKAAVLTHLGERDRALDEIRALLENGSVPPASLAHASSYVAELRGDPRFDALLQAATSRTSDSPYTVSRRSRADDRPPPTSEGGR